MGQHALRGIFACILGFFLLFENHHATATPLSPATYAVSDYGSGSGAHGVWFQRFDSASSSTRFTFLDGGTFSVGGTAANLSGSIRDKSNPSRGFDVSLVFEKVSDAVAMTLAGKCEQGGCDTSGWHYFNLTMGMMTGTGGLTGLNLNLLQRPADGSYPWQIGIGASSKNFIFGGAMWFDWEIKGDNTSNVSVCTSSLNCGSDYHGDFNVNLSLLPEVSTELPEPASLGLLIAGLIGLGCVVRQRRQAV